MKINLFPFSPRADMRLNASTLLYIVFLIFKDCIEWCGILKVRRRQHSPQELLLAGHLEQDKRPNHLTNLFLLPDHLPVIDAFTVDLMPYWHPPFWKTQIGHHWKYISQRLSEGNTRVLLNRLLNLLRFGYFCWIFHFSVPSPEQDSCFLMLCTAFCNSQQTVSNWSSLRVAVSSQALHPTCRVLVEWMICIHRIHLYMPIWLTAFAASTAARAWITKRFSLFKRA